MAWFANLVFRGEKFIGDNPSAVTEGVTFFSEFELAARQAKTFTHYTVVTVSAYELYMEPQRYTAITTDHYLVNHEAGIGWMARSAGPLLTTAQAKAVKECLIERSPEAWEAAEPAVRAILEAEVGG